VKEAARQILRRAVVSGKIVKPWMCQYCGKNCTLHGHHTDYAKPLEVVWLCCLCHAGIHKKHHYELEARAAAEDANG